MQKSKKIVKKEVTPEMKTLVYKFWNLVNIKKLANKCKISERLVYAVYNNERTDNRNIIYNAYKQITTYMQ